MQANNGRRECARASWPAPFFSRQMLPAGWPAGRLAEAASQLDRLIGIKVRARATGRERQERRHELSAARMQYDCH